MLPTSPEVAEEITRRGERRLLSPRAEVDWDDDGYGGPSTIDDLSGQLAELTISREITTTLPDAVRQVVTGSSAASCTLTLAKGEEFEARLGSVRYWSGTNPASPLAGKPREHRPARVHWRFITPNDVEDLIAFSGRTTDASVDRDGTATIELLDHAEDFRGPADLPLVLADDQTPDGGRKPGLDGGWLIDYLARQRGYYTSPPPRPDSKVVATMHGSAFPEVGEMNIVYSVDFEPINFAPRGFCKAAIFGGNVGSRCEYLTEGGYIFRTSPGRQFYVEGRVEQQTTLPTGRGLFMVTSGTNGISLFVNNSGNLAVYIKTPDSGPHVTNTAFHVGTGVRRYVALHVAFGTNTASISVRLDGQGATFGTLSGFDNTSTGQPALAVCHVGRSYINTVSDIAPWHGFVDNVQFGEADITGSWTDAYTSPHTIQPSLNELYVVPVTEPRDAWNLVQEIAAAEFGVARFTTSGAFEFLNRDAFTQPPYNQVQRTLTTSTAIKALSTNRAVDTVRNHVIIRAQPVSVLPPRDVWALTIQHIHLAASGQAGDTRTFAVAFDFPVYNLDTSVLYAGGGVGAVDGSRYRAARNRDGTGGVVSNLSWTVSQFGNYAAVSVTNPNAFDVWVVQPAGIVGLDAGDVGRPAFALSGSPVLTDRASESGAAEISSKIAIDKTNPTSIAEYGEQVLQLDDSPWRQDLDSIEGIADHLLADLAAPSVLFEDVPIVGDPRLEPLDLVQLQDDDGFVLDAPFRLYRVQTEWQAPGTGGGDGILGQTITVRGHQ